MRQIPYIDLHRHLDGNLRLETMIDLADDHGLSLPAMELEALRPHVQIVTAEADLAGFLRKVELMASVLADVDACRRVARENVEDAHFEGLDYVELRFSPGFMALAHGLRLEAVVEAVIDGARAGAREHGVEVRLIGILSRTYGPSAVGRELEALLAYRNEITALDLAGDEPSWPGSHFVEHFRRGRDAGWAVTVHAGEAAGAESVWQAIRELGAVRLGHAVRATEDPELLDYLAEHGIGVESCLTSNVQTSAVPSFDAHPLREFLDRGILATINTDDPSVSGIDLSHELTVAAPQAGLTESHIQRARENAVEIAFLSREQKDALSTRAGKSG